MGSPLLRPSGLVEGPPSPSKLKVLQQQRQGHPPQVKVELTEDKLTEEAQLWSYERRAAPVDLAGRLWRTLRTGITPTSIASNFYEHV